MAPPNVSRRSFLALALVILAVAGLLRTVWLTSDQPTTHTVGVVWHDEGPWVHNARNRALWGVWRTDNWNPMFLAPVFTGLEYAAFSAFGVGTWQARTVPVISGLAAIAFLMAGLAAVADRRTALLGGALLAANYGFVMWNRAALMESTMTAFIVISWAAYAMAQRRPMWGLVAGLAAILAFFTKASAAFFIAALGVEVLLGLIGGLVGARRREAVWTLAGLAAAGGIIGAAFVLPNWTEFRFYNWEMSVARKPEYTLEAFKNRATWLPLVQDFFLWMWPIFAAAALAIVDIAARGRQARPAERLLALWVLIGLLELVVHDSGNWRRYVMFIPALIALGVLWMNRRAGQAARDEPSRPVRASMGTRWFAAPLVCALAYLVIGSLVRVMLAGDVRAGLFSTTVQVSAGASLLLAAAVFLAWGSVSRWLADPRIPVVVTLGLVCLTAGFDLTRFGAWAGARQTVNYEASVEVGRLLPPGTLVHGKLANGLSLENRIRPVFIGNGFGNYADRLQRDDARYILTYVFPSVGYESQAESGMIQELLSHYARHRTVATFAVNDTGGPDRAALIDKFPGP
jgi:4-amino-4-deoxy-L-arabinose transferase-like glycosyltransferase